MLRNIEKELEKEKELNNKISSEIMKKNKQLINCEIKLREFIMPYEINKQEIDNLKLELRENKQLLISIEKKNFYLREENNLIKSQFNNEKNNLIEKFNNLEVKITSKKNVFGNF